MEYATLIVLLALVQYVWFSMRVGMAREKYKIDAPACTGDENFERLFRVQQNTLEQLIVFVPAIFAFTHFLSPLWALIMGAVFIIGRLLYSAEYIKDPKTRTLGMLLTLLPNAVLILGALFGIIKGML
jgi:glutathione S-transferase